MRNLILKSINVVNQVRYPEIRTEYRACITANHYSRLSEVKHLVNDYLLRRRYKTIAYHGEFQQELTFALPFAYWHHLNGTLNKTISSRNTKELYFFSESHEEKFDKREWKGWNYSFDIPNTSHCHSFSYKKWTRVPLKQHYKNRIFKFAKPTLVVANKYNIEWNKSPVNFFDKPALDKIFRKYKDTYQIVYNRPTEGHIVNDNSAILDLNEFQWIRDTHPEVMIMNDLYAADNCQANNFNHLQLMVYANCEHFVSVHGGTAALASYFEGTNIILSKEGLEHYFREYETIFPALSGARILHALSENDIMAYMEKYF